MISPHTAAMMVAGFISPRATLRTVSGSPDYTRITASELYRP